MLKDIVILLAVPILSRISQMNPVRPTASIRFHRFFIDKGWGDVKMLIYYELFGGQVGMVLN